MLGGANNNFLTILNKIMLDAEPLMGQQAKENQIIAALTARLTADAIEEVLQGVTPRHYLPTRQLDYKNKPRALGVIYEKFDERAITPQQSLKNSLINAKYACKQLLNDREKLFKVCFNAIHRANQNADIDIKRLISTIDQIAAFKQCFVANPLLIMATNIANAIGLKIDLNSLNRIKVILLQGVDIDLSGVKFNKEDTKKKLLEEFNLTDKQQKELDSQIDKITFEICLPLTQWLQVSDKLLKYIDQHIDDDNDDNQRLYNPREWVKIFFDYKDALIQLLEHLEVEQQRLDWTEDDKEEFKKDAKWFADTKRFYEQPLDVIIEGLEAKVEQQLRLEKKIRIKKKKLVQSSIDTGSDNELVQLLSSMHIDISIEDAKPVDANVIVEHLPYNPLVERNSAGDNAFIVLARKNYFRAVEALFDNLEKYFSPESYLEFAPIVLRANEAGETILGFALKYEDFDYAKDYLDELGERTLKGTSLNAKILSNMWGCVNGWTFNAHSPDLANQLEVFKAMLTHRLFDAKVFLTLGNAEPVLTRFLNFKDELKKNNKDTFEEVGDTLNDIISRLNALVDQKREHAYRQQQERRPKVRGLRA